MTKTNALRLITQAGIPHRTASYDFALTEPDNITPATQFETYLFDQTGAGIQNPGCPGRQDRRGGLLHPGFVHPGSQKGSQGLGQQEGGDGAYE